ncbi:MAG: hypothetical protein KDC57_22830 [Saprospiraceae bacterium]|nr:hypothetical protein [Saprospiraceae bacterium]
MVAAYRDQINASFSSSVYEQFMHELSGRFDHRPLFRVAESPVIFDLSLLGSAVQAGEEVVNFLLSEQFKTLSKRLLDRNVDVPNETPNTMFLQVDLGICEVNGQLTPRLIEVQGFPSLYFYQLVLAESYRKSYPFLESLDHLFADLNPESYVELLRRHILAGEKPEHVVLVDIEPHKQNTYIDFLATRHYLGIPVKCITDIKRAGRSLYYLDDAGRKVAIHKLYNRVIFDELLRRTDLNPEFTLREDVEVNWAGHPNWYFKISKHLLPYIQSDYVPKSRFVHEILDDLPANLEDYVLKPLYSFSGEGVKFDLTPQDLLELRKPDEYILQEKVTYAPVIRTPNEPAKVELRLMYLWPFHKDRPILIHNLIRMSKGKMIGVKFNKDKDWVGGSIGFYQHPNKR